MNTPTVTTKQEGNSKEQSPAGEAPDVIVDSESATPDPFELQQGVLVDKDGRRVALVKPQTWY